MPRNRRGGRKNKQPQHFPYPYHPYQSPYPPMFMPPPAMPMPMMCPQFPSFMPNMMMQYPYAASASTQPGPSTSTAPSAATGLQLPYLPPVAPSAATGLQFPLPPVAPSTVPSAATGLQFPLPPVAPSTNPSAATGLQFPLPPVAPSTNPSAATGLQFPLPPVAPSTNPSAATGLQFPLPPVAQVAPLKAPAPQVLTPAAQQVPGTSMPSPPHADMSDDLPDSDDQADDDQAVIVEGMSANCSAVYLPGKNKPDDLDIFDAPKEKTTQGKGRKKGDINKATRSKLEASAAAWVKQTKAFEQSQGRRTRSRQANPKQKESKSATQKIDLQDQFSDTEDEDGDC